MNKYSGLRISFIGFILAAAGVAGGFIGFAVERRWISLVAFGVTLLGIAIGFGGIIYAWVRTGRDAIKGSIPASKELAAKIKRNLK